MVLLREAVVDHYDILFKTEEEEEEQEEIETLVKSFDLHRAQDVLYDAEC